MLAAHTIMSYKHAGNMQSIDHLTAVHARVGQLGPCSRSATPIVE